MRQRFLVLLTLVPLLFCAATAHAVWDISIESKSVDPSATDVNVVLTASWDVHLAGLTVPLVARSTQGGAFWTGALPYDTGGFGFDHPNQYNVSWTWLAPWAVLIEEYRPGVPGGDCPTEGDTGYDGVSPDHFVLNAATSTLTASAQPTGWDVVNWTFDVGAAEGTFEFDTACFTDQLPTIFMIDGDFPPTDHGPDGTDETTFTKGIITVGTVSENEAPTIVTCPAGQTVDIAQAVNLTIEATDDGNPDPPGALTIIPTGVPAFLTFTDNGDGTATLVGTPGCADADQAYPMSFVANDGELDSEPCAFTLTVNPDTEDPVITCPADIAIECDESTDPANTGSATADDNCDEDVEITYSDATAAGDCPQDMVITRTWTATDDAGNTATCDQTITVDDTTPPVITCPPDIAVECGDPTDPAALGEATATDNCGAVTISFGDVTTPGACPGQYTITRTWTAEDECGNITSCDQTITVDDSTDPVITCPPDAVAECGDPVDPAALGEATATDACDAEVDITYDDVMDPGTCPGEYVISRTWTATDDCGNTATCVQTITVEDTTPPVLSECPESIEVECDAIPAPPEITATDACGEEVTVTFDEVVDGAIITRTWTATDACNNSTECVQVLTVVDTTPPEITCPPNIAISDTDPTDPSFTGEATAVDNCDQEVVITYDDVVTTGQIERTWTATDNNANSESCVQIITITEENLPPAFTNCPEAPVELTEGDSFEYTPTYGDPNGDQVTLTAEMVPASANWDGTTFSWDTGCDDAGSYTVRFIVSDSELADTCEVVINVADDPVMLMVDPTELTFNYQVGGAMPAAQQVEVTNSGCGEVNVGHSASEDWLSATPPDLTTPGTFDVTVDPSSLTPGQYTAQLDFMEVPAGQKLSGNGAFVLVTLNIADEDNVAPEITCPDDIAVNVGDMIELAVSATDANDDPLTLRAEMMGGDPIPGFTDNGDGTGMLSTIALCDYMPSITVCFIAADDDLADTCCVTVTVMDATPPDLICPADFELSADGNCMAELPAVVIEAADNCDQDLTIEMEPAAGEMLGLGETIVSVSATDDAGNSSSCDFTVTVVDNTAPTITCPDDITVPDDGSGTGSTVDFTVTAEDNCEVESLTGDYQSGDFFPTGTTEVSYTAEDAAGNSASCSFFVTVEEPVTNEICGTIVDENQVGIPACIEIWDFFPGGEIIASGCADENGEFCISLPLRRAEVFDYVVRIILEGYFPVIVEGVFAGEVINVELPEVGEPTVTPYVADYWGTSSGVLGTPLLVGDVITAYDPQNTLCGVAYVENPGEYLIHVYGDDDATTPDFDEGAVDGDTITFKINNGCPLKAENPWMNRASFNEELNFVCEQVIELCDDWTLISINRTMESTDVEDVLAPIDGYYERIISSICGIGAVTYDINRPDALNDLTDFNNENGFWLYAPGASELTVPGDLVPADTPLPLCMGWNVASYLPNECDDLEHAFMSIDGIYEYAIAYDCDAGAQTYDPLRPEELNDLQCLCPGQGVWIKMLDDETLEYPTSGYECTEEADILPRAVNLTTSVTPTPWVCDFWSAGSADGPVSGSVISVRDEDGTICGQGVALHGGMFLVHVYGDDPVTEADEGAVAGSELTFEINDEVVGNAEWVFRGSIEITLDRPSSGTQVPDAYELHQNYPNPFNAGTAISFTLPTTSDWTLVIYDIVGREVDRFTGNSPAGVVNLHWNADGAASGVYFYRLTAKGFTDTKKMTLMK